MKSQHTVIGFTYVTRGDSNPVPCFHLSVHVWSSLQSSSAWASNSDDTGHRSRAAQWCLGRKYWKTCGKTYGKTSKI